MTRPVWATSFGSEFDDFLFAPIGEESNGMMLSVISALARLDLDPWHETVKLAELPGETATTRLASLIAALPGVPSAHQNPEAIAARLVALLPRGHNSKVESRKVQIGADAVTKLRVGIFMYAVFILVVLSAQGIVASRLPTAKIGNASAPASSTVSPLPLPPKSGG
jgi:hypothetical protein